MTLPIKKQGILIASFALLSLFASLLFTSGTAHADYSSAPSQLPIDTPGLNGPATTYINLSNQPNDDEGNGLYMTSVTFKIYSNVDPSSNDVARTILLDFTAGKPCSNQYIWLQGFYLNSNETPIWGGDIIGNLQEDPGVPIPPYPRATQKLTSCGSYGFRFDPAAFVYSSVPEHSGLWVAYFTVNYGTWGTGTLRFHVRTEQGASKLSFVQGQPALLYHPNDLTAQNIYQMPFQYLCSSYGSNSTLPDRRVTWRDDDQNLRPQKPFILHASLYENGNRISFTGVRPRNADWNWRGVQGAPPPASPGEEREISFQAKIDAKYMLQLEIVKGGNGIAVTPPTDSINYYLDFGCSTPHISINCGTVTTSNMPAGQQYYLYFYEGYNDGFGYNVAKRGSAGGPPFTGNVSLNTFNYFSRPPFVEQEIRPGSPGDARDPTASASSLWPSWTYRVIVADAATRFPMAFADLGRCMTASCNLSIQTSPDGAPEPGQNVTANYGMSVYNNANSAWPGREYNVRVTSSGGARFPNIQSNLVVYPGTNTFAGSAGGHFDYTGTMEARIFLVNTDITSLVVTGGQPCRASKTPYTRPTLRVTNGDISTGGGFADASLVCSAGKSSFIGPSSSNNKPGGIRTFASVGSGGSSGSGADFGAYALGLIDGSSGDPAKHGFYSDAVRSGQYRTLNFANTVTLGGLMGGNIKDNANANAHCAPDYFNTTRLSASLPDPGANFNLSGKNGQYLHEGNVTIDGGTITAGNSVTVYVKGDVYIRNNISYGPWRFDFANHSNNAPYLMIIALGNIHIDPGVDSLDGVYVAQPNGESGGIFSTCSPGGVQATNANVGSACTRPLTIKGAVIAQHTYNLRAANSLLSGGVSETYDFSPSSVLGTPSLKENDSIESLFNLPPVF